MLTNGSMNIFPMHGRALSAPRVFTNSDGSRSVSVQLFVKRDYVSTDPRTGERKYGVEDLFTFEDFIPADKELPAVYSLIHPQTRLVVAFKPRPNSWRDAASGKTIYTTVLDIRGIDVLDTKGEGQAKAARAQQDQGSPAQQGQAVQQAQAAPVQNQAPAEQGGDIVSPFSGQQGQGGQPAQQPQQAQQPIPGGFTVPAPMNAPAQNQQMAFGNVPSNQVYQEPPF